MARSILRVVSLVTALVIVLLAACGGSENAVTRAALEDGCLIDTDCTSPLVCAFKTCHEQCFADGGVGATPDCPPGQLCVASDRPYYVCQPITLCSLNSQCPSPLVCARDGECRDECESSRDCVAGQSCIDGTCVAPDDPDLVEGGLVAPDSGSSADGAVAQGAPCSYDSDCPEPLECRDGQCAFACVTSRDCAAGQSCVGGTCVSGGGLPGDGGADGGALPPDYGASCALNSDCSSTLICGKDARCVYACNTSFDCDVAHGACCSAHMCLPGSACNADAGSRDSGLDGGPDDAGPACSADLDCQDGVFCDGYERCVNRHCQSAAPACDDQDPCTTDTCTEATQSCTHSADGPVDADHDGHVVLACGGDDCDDTNPDVYPGHPEICDGLDNNCNGFADEGLWTNQVPLALPSTFGAGEDSADTPAIVRLADGSFAVLGGASSGCSNATLFHVNASITSGDTGTTLFSDGDCNVSQLLATDGVSVLASQRHDLGTHFTSALYPPSTGGTVNVVLGDKTSSGNYSVSNGAAIYVPSLGRYALVYSDARLFGTSSAVGSIFATSVTAAGPIADDFSLLASTADDIGDSSNSVTAASGGHTTRIQAASNGSTVLVAWTANDTNQVRYALFDLQLTTVRAPAVDLAGSDEVIAQSAITTDGGYVLATSDVSGTSNRLIAIDGASGVAGTTQAVVSTVPASEIRLAALGTGIVVTMRSGGNLRYGYVTGALDKTVAFTDLHVGPATGSVAPIDATHAALTWYDQDGTDTSLQVALMVCGGT